MKICRYNGNQLGVVDENKVIDITDVLQYLPCQAWPYPQSDYLIQNLAEIRRFAENLQQRVKRYRLDEIELSAPITTPSKIIGAPINYVSHGEEISDDLRHGHKLGPMQEMGLFLKAGTSIIGASQSIKKRFPNQRTDHEVELAVVIGVEGNNITRAQAMQHVAGYMIGLDITLRGPQFQCFRKSIDSYCVLGPWLVTADEVQDPMKLQLELQVNGELRQSSSTAYMIHDIAALIEHASSHYTLMPGDVILTGTPEGVGPLKAGDTVRASIEGIGVMDIKVEDA